MLLNPNNNGNARKPWWDLFTLGCGDRQAGELEDGEACMYLTFQSQLRLAEEEREEEERKRRGTDPHGRAAAAQDIFFLTAAQ